MKIFITRQKRKQAANPKQRQKPKPKPKPNPKTYFEFCTSGGLSVACQACQPAPPSPFHAPLPRWWLKKCLAHCLYIVTVVTVADVGRQGPVRAPLFAVTFNLFARSLRFVSFRN